MNHMTDRQIIINVYVSQAIMFFIACILSFFVFKSWASFTSLFNVNSSAFIIGIGVGLVIVCINVILAKILPKEWLDDGGINVRVFRSLSMLERTFLCFIVAVSEELLFRGVLQSALGLLIASTIFALIHFRYLQKPVLFLNVLSVSILLGILFYVTNNVVVTIVVHFVVNFVLGTIIRYDYMKIIKNER